MNLLLCQAKFIFISNESIKNYIDLKKELHLLATLKCFISLFILFYWLYFNCCAKILLASSYPKFFANWIYCGEKLIVPDKVFPKSLLG